jgi:hypothetical protein
VLVHENYRDAVRPAVATAVETGSDYIVDFRIRHSSGDLDKGDENRKVCSLHLTLMDRMGVKLDGFGDATTRLAEL